MLKRARHTRQRPGRLCDNPNHFNKYIASKVNVKNAKPFEVCGVDILARNDATTIGQKIKDGRLPLEQQKNRYIKDEESD
eukprot:14590393-Ditylum_brightwellii.AAC.1